MAPGSEANARKWFARVRGGSSYRRLLAKGILSAAPNWVRGQGGGPDSTVSNFFMLLAAILLISPGCF
jgi:hypothetical protein